MGKLILGGARSGKSQFAESLANDYVSVSYIATAVIFDEEIAKRVENHQRQRPVHWQTHESPIKLADAISKANTDADCILLDCLTFWVNNCLYDCEQTWAQERSQFVEVIGDLKTEIIIVSNESGLGVIPVGQQTRRYIDEVGLLHQQLAQQLETVVLVVAGLPNVLKGVLHTGENNG